ncbi:hypothetical protein N7539_005270 [Penicillium diatomitis]|uniref:NAD dependent epimerase/dehydratase n=1 Tax=Penicillium diatomitis TaxID=2819901 RepID=A0A9X0BUU2_9EURO|nr:uncharacterized protein N7539_005270 [Penicillium diatomitis]KAJ5485282.1 hypothetical protein N7539_005270 [Penicillium diatomitis]
MEKSTEQQRWRDPFAGEPPRDPSRTLQVIGAGLPRTGTISLTLALTWALHGDVCHGGSACLRGKEHIIKGWTKCLDPPKDVSQEEVDKTLKDLLVGYVATTDAPAIFFVEELVRLYPDAKVVCTTREPTRWWESYQELINTLDNPLFILLQLVQPTLRYSLAWKLAIVKRRRQIYPAELEPLGPHFMELHSDYLKRVVPKDRLLFFDMKEGWEPLCKFLDVPIPEKPFPQVHDRASMKSSWAPYWWRGAAIWLTILAAGYGLSQAVSYARLRMHS